MLAVSGMSKDAGLLLQLSYHRCLRNACEHSNLKLFKAVNGEDCYCTCHCSPPFKLLSPSIREVLKFQTGISMTSSTIKTCKQADSKEEFIIYLDASIKENELTIGNLNQIKQTILDNSNIISDSFCSSLSQFTFERTHLPILEICSLGHT